MLNGWDQCSDGSLLFLLIDLLCKWHWDYVLTSKWDFFFFCLFRRWLTIQELWCMVVVVGGYKNTLRQTCESLTMTTTEKFAHLFRFFSFLQKSLPFWWLHFYWFSCICDKNVDTNTYQEASIKYWLWYSINNDIERKSVWWITFVTRMEKANDTQKPQKNNWRVWTMEGKKDRDREKKGRINQSQSFNLLLVVP